MPHQSFQRETLPHTNIRLRKHVSHRQPRDFSKLHHDRAMQVSQDAQLQGMCYLIWQKPLYAEIHRVQFMLTASLIDVDNPVEMWTDVLPLSLPSTRRFKSSRSTDKVASKPLGMLLSAHSCLL
jgi:hypothetical protein